MKNSAPPSLDAWAELNQAVDARAYVAGLLHEVLEDGSLSPSYQGFIIEALTEALRKSAEIVNREKLPCRQKIS